MNHDLTTLLSKLKRTTREREVDLRWVAPSLWHITLAFLGEAAGSLDFLEEWRPGAGETKLRLAGLGAFPSNDHARVLWLGVSASKEFLDLQASLAERLTAAGFVLEDRPYRPHLTLARFRNPMSAADLVELGGRKHFGDYPVAELVLFESVLQGNVVKYTPVRRWGIGAG
jgi:2'-5' RNA ligase